ncbi:OmpA family protein [Epilithonimonas sp. JDS]|uniref:OmpA family protein n=1 Tax=Epilithonimonas sp. JDS TaxID=2902797 RepID=UPI001E560730|nr:OmpA family protein [Epilithonimonas sp. JDS]MCD9853564.1 OmpA family protein [Epilithonimonas sp. JDS]
MRKSLLLLSLIFVQYFNSQFRNSLYDENQINVSLRGGLDFPSYDNQTKYIDYKPNLNLGISADYYFNWIGLGIDADYLSNKPKNSYPTENLYLGAAKLSNPTLTENNIQRYFFGIGPNFRWVINDDMGVTFKLKGGISNIKGGETSLISANGATNYNLNFHNGYDVKSVFSGKGEVEFNWFFSENIGLNVGGYYLQHFKTNDIVTNGNAAGYIPFTSNDNQNLISPANAEIRTSVLDHEIHSVGVFAGLTFRFPIKEAKPEYNLNVVAKDKETGLVLPDTFIELYKDGKRNYLARTNAQGVAFFKNIKPENYEIRGKLNTIELNSTKTNKSEFVKNSTIRKEISTDSDKFYVKGQVNICNSKNPLRDVTVVIRNNETEIVQEIKTNIEGKFYFKADKNSTYNIYGKKGNYFSQTETVTSKNVDRSNTLFLNLQVCMEETSCGKPINLKNIHYDLDKFFIRKDAEAELNKMFQFMKDNPNVKVELASHTDSRASDDYNKTLSQNRANAAVEYLVSKGIDKARLKPIGYGESQLLNKCSNDVDCTEEQHQTNRRTEMKVICH